MKTISFSEKSGLAMSMLMGLLLLLAIFQLNSNSNSYLSPTRVQAETIEEALDEEGDFGADMKADASLMSYLNSIDSNSDPHTIFVPKSYPAPPPADLAQILRHHVAVKLDLAEVENLPLQSETLHTGGPGNVAQILVIARTSSTINSVIFGNPHIPGGSSRIEDDPPIVADTAAGGQVILRRIATRINLPRTIQQTLTWTLSAEMRSRLFPDNDDPLDIGNMNGVTILAPDNTAFSLISEAESGFDQSDVDEMLRDHIYDNNVLTSFELEEGFETGSTELLIFDSLESSPTNITRTGSSTNRRYFADGSRFEYQDVLTNQGVIHLINKVLRVPQDETNSPTLRPTRSPVSPTSEDDGDLDDDNSSPSMFTTITFSLLLISLLSQVFYF